MTRRHGQRTRRRFSTGVLVGALVVATGLATASEPPTPGRHDEHSRFTDQSEGFPPQPRDATNVRLLASDAAEVRAGDPDPSAPFHAQMKVDWVKAYQL